MATLPLAFALPNWYTTRFIAARLGKDITTIQKWIRSGLLLKRGYRVVFTSSYKGGRCWIYIDPARKDGMLRKCTLDSLPVVSAISKGEGTIPIR